MSGDRLLLDTNIVLYFLAGDATLLPLFEEKDLIVSVITELELLGYQELSDKERTSITQFLHHCTIMDVTSDVKEKAINIRRSYRIKLPDAMIMALHSAEMFQ